jgi:hypothetical protein
VVRRKVERLERLAPRTVAIWDGQKQPPARSHASHRGLDQLVDVRQVLQSLKGANGVEGIRLAIRKFCDGDRMRLDSRRGELGYRGTVGVQPDHAPN